MKTKKLVTILGMFSLLLYFTSCNKVTNSLPGTIQLNALASSSAIKSAAIKTTTGTITLSTATVEIQNVTIEENSGNDNENGGTDVSEAGDGADNEKKSQESDGGDVVLAGPYVLDIVSGNASIDQVSVQPGQYKKVDFDFTAGPENNGNAIFISGEYTSSAGIAIPFELSSDLNSTVQLPLTNTINVISGSTVSVSIVFEVQSWLNSIDFGNASLTGNKIIISKQQNTALYNAFTAALNKHIQVED